MQRIDKAVLFTGDDNGWHEQKAMLSSFHKFVAEAGKTRWCEGIVPIYWQITRLKVLSSYIVWRLGHGQNQIVRGLAFIEVNEILQHSQGLMF